MGCRRVFSAPFPLLLGFPTPVTCDILWILFLPPLFSMDIVDPTQCPQWDEILLNTPGSSFFHTSSWAKVLKESYGYKPIYFAEVGDNRIGTLIPFAEINSLLTGKRGVSLPFTDSCGLILEDGVQFKKYFDQIKEFGKNAKWKSMELRGGDHWHPEALPASTYIGHALNISRDEDSIFEGFRDSTKRNIKKAIKEGVQVKIDHSFESVKEFYRLNCLTRKRHGLPPQPFKFFQKIFECIISQRGGFISLASFAGHYVAGAMFFQFGDSAIFKYGASDKKYQHLRANNLVMWQAIREIMPEWLWENTFRKDRDR